MKTTTYTESEIFENNFNLEAYTKFLKQNKQNRVQGGLRDQMTTQEKVLVQTRIDALNGKVLQCVLCKKPVGDVINYCHNVAKNNGGGMNWENMFVADRCCNIRQADTNLVNYVNESTFIHTSKMSKVLPTKEEKLLAATKILSRHFLDSQKLYFAEKVLSEYTDYSTYNYG